MVKPKHLMKHPDEYDARLGFIMVYHGLSFNDGFDMLTHVHHLQNPNQIDDLRIPTELFHLTLVCSDQFVDPLPTNGMSPHDHCGKPGKARLNDEENDYSICTFQRMSGRPNVRHSGDPQERFRTH